MLFQVKFLYFLFCWSCFLFIPLRAKWKKSTQPSTWCQRVCLSVCNKFWPQLSQDWQNRMGWNFLGMSSSKSHIQNFLFFSSGPGQRAEKPIHLYLIYYTLFVRCYVRAPIKCCKKLLFPSTEWRNIPFSLCSCLFVLEIAKHFHLMLSVINAHRWYCFVYMP